MADFHLNATAEMQGRPQVARLWHMTDDPGVKDLLRFLITRDHFHQMLWLRVIEELKSDGLDSIPVPEAFDLDEELPEFVGLYVHASDGPAATEGGLRPGQDHRRSSRRDRREHPEELRRAPDAAARGPTAVRHSTGRPLDHDRQGEGRPDLTSGLAAPGSRPGLAAAAVSQPGPGPG